MTTHIELAEGARNAVRTCLDIQPKETVVIYTDRETLDIGRALKEQVDEVGAPVRMFVIEDYAERPATELPDPVAAGFEQAHVSIFCAGLHPGELKMRMAMTGIVKKRRMRHAHMVGITKRIMAEGMRADYHQVAALTKWVRERAEIAKEITGSNSVIEQVDKQPKNQIDTSKLGALGMEFGGRVRLEQTVRELLDA